MGYDWCLMIVSFSIDINELLDYPNDLAWIDKSDQLTFSLIHSDFSAKEFEMLKIININEIINSRDSDLKQTQSNN